MAAAGSSKASFTQEDINLIRLRFMNTRTSKKILHNVFCKGTKERGPRESLFNFYSRRGIKVDRLKKILNTNQKKIIQKDPTGATFDVSLLFVCIRHGNDGITRSKKSDCWTQGKNLLESKLIAIKNSRNDIVHCEHTYDNSQLYQKTEELRSLFRDTIKLAGERYSVSPAMVTREIDEMNHDLNKYRDKPFLSRNLEQDGSSQAPYIKRHHKTAAVPGATCMDPQEVERVMEQFVRFCSVHLSQLPQDLSSTQRGIYDTNIYNNYSKTNAEVYDSDGDSDCDNSDTFNDDSDGDSNCDNNDTFYDDSNDSDRESNCDNNEAFYDDSNGSDGDSNCDNNDTFYDDSNDSDGDSNCDNNDTFYDDSNDNDGDSNCDNNDTFYDDSDGSDGDSNCDNNDTFYDDSNFNDIEAFNNGSNDDSDDYYDENIYDNHDNYGFYDNNEEEEDNGSEECIYYDEDDIEDDGYVDSDSYDDDGEDEGNNDIFDDSEEDDEERDVYGAADSLLQEISHLVSQFVKNFQLGRMTQREIREKDDTSQ